MYIYSKDITERKENPQILHKFTNILDMKVVFVYNTRPRTEGQLRV